MQLIWYMIDYRNSSQVTKNVNFNFMCMSLVFMVMHKKGLDSRVIKRSKIMFPLKCLTIFLAKK